MILRCAKALVPLAAASLIPLPAQADVLEIGPGGEARWITEPGAEPAPLTAGPIAEVPAEIARVADYAASPRAPTGETASARQRLSCQTTASSSAGLRSNRAASSWILAA